MIEDVPTSITAFVGVTPRGPLNEPTTVHDFAGYDRLFGGMAAASTMTYAVQHFFQNGGREAVIVRATDAEIVPELRGPTGLYALDRADLFNLLCIPPPEPGATLSGGARRRAAEYCRERRALFLVDPDPVWREPGDVMSAFPRFVSGISGSNAALYFPAVRMADPEQGGALASFPPCGAVAGVMARIDAAHGVWKAPAGSEATLAGAASLTVDLTSEESGQLNRLGVSCLRTFPGVGSVVWGARTLEAADPSALEWRYVPVRRLALFLEESLDRGTRWAATEPNGEALWNELRRSVGAFMYDLFWRGAFQGATPADGYFVKCDSETTTQADIDRGVVNIVVGFAAVRRAEFLTIEIQQRAGGVG